MIFLLHFIGAFSDCNLNRYDLNSRKSARNLIEYRNFYTHLSRFKSSTKFCGIHAELLSGGSKKFQYFFEEVLIQVDEPTCATRLVLTFTDFWFIEAGDAYLVL